MHTIELTDEELRLLQAALHSYLDDFGHEEADVLRQIKALIAKLPPARLSARSPRPLEPRRLENDDRRAAALPPGRVGRRIRRGAWASLQGVDLGRGDRALGRRVPLGVARSRRPGAAEPGARADREGAGRRRGVRRRGDDRGRASQSKSSRAAASRSSSTFDTESSPTGADFPIRSNRGGGHGNLHRGAGRQRTVSGQRTRSSGNTAPSAKRSIR